MTDSELTNAEWDERDRRLSADIEDARKALKLAQDRYDRLYKERSEMRSRRRQQAIAKITAAVERHRAESNIPATSA